MEKKITFPLPPGCDPEGLSAGDEVRIDGFMYVARDAAHKRLVEAIERNEDLPMDVGGCLIYYMGPSPAPEGRVIGSCGPTTSSRMDRYTVALLKKGLKATMGKGDRDKSIIEACIRYRAVYLVTYGGCGAYLGQFVKKSRVVAYPELGPESILRLDVEGFPALVGIDIKGKNLYNK